MDKQQFVIKTREKSGLSVDDFAELCCVSSRTVQRWEYGETSVPDSKIKLIKMIFKNKKRGES